VGDALYVLGGIEKDEARGEITVSSVLKFDSRMQTWSEVAPMPAERDNAGACVLGSNIYIFGGRNDAMEKASTTYRFSTETNEWATLASMQMFWVGIAFVSWTASSTCWEDRKATITTPAQSIASISWQMCGARWRPCPSMECYSVASDSWSEVRGGELSTVRSCFGALVVRLERDFFDSLIAKAKSEGLCLDFKAYFTPNLFRFCKVLIMLMNTITRGCFCIFWVRRLVPGGLNVPALDRNQSLLPLHCIFITCSYVLFLLPKKGGDPRQALTVVSPSHLTSRVCAEAVLLSTLYTPPSTYAWSSFHPAYSALLPLHLLDQLVLVRPLFCYSLPR
jgi:hypothetical protein